MLEEKHWARHHTECEQVDQSESERSASTAEAVVKFRILQTRSVKSLQTSEGQRVSAVHEAFAWPRAL